MRICVIYGANAMELEVNANHWLELNENQKVIISISPISNHPNGGGYILITYTDKEKFFEKIQ